MPKMKIEGSFRRPDHRRSIRTAKSISRRFRTLLQFHQDNGNLSRAPHGSTGEVSMLSPDERRQIVVENGEDEDRRDEVLLWLAPATIPRPRSPICAMPRDNGADGGDPRGSRYICAAEADIEAFFLEVADAVETARWAIYNNPPRVKSDLHWEPSAAAYSNTRTTSCIKSRPRASARWAGRFSPRTRNVSVMCCDSPQSRAGRCRPCRWAATATANMTGNIAPAEIAAISTPWKKLCPKRRPFKKEYLRCLPLLHFTYSAIQSRGSEVADAGAWPAAGALREAAARPGRGCRPKRRGDPGPPSRPDREIRPGGRQPPIALAAE